jgi:hypothetical protein
MTSTKLSCNYPKTYLHISEGLLDDLKRFSARKRAEEIAQRLQEQLNKNKTKTMTFTEDGLMLAIKIIREEYGIEN